MMVPADEDLLTPEPRHSRRTCVAFAGISTSLPARLGLGMGEGDVPEAWRGRASIWGLPRTLILLLPPPGTKKRFL